jgi:polyferredoxin
VFLALSAAAAWSLATRVPLKVNIERDRSVLSREVAGGAVENIFRMQITNASEAARTFAVVLEGLPGIRLAEAVAITVPPAATQLTTLQVHVDAGGADAGAQPIRIRVTDTADPAVSVTEAAKFWMP